MLLRAGDPVSAGDVIDRVWGDRVPAKPAAALHSLVLRLRRALGDHSGSLIRAHGSGYLIAVEPGHLDVGQFEELWTRARAAGDAVRRAELMRAALAVWRGDPLADVRSDALHRLDVPALMERRAQAAEEHFEAELAIGRHAEIVPLLRQAVARTPLREGLWRQLMLALYHSGRQAEALDAYRQLHKLLDTELGLEPGPPIRQLQRDILNAERSLLRPPTLALAEPAPTDGPLFQLPADSGELRGRDRAVAELRRLLTNARAQDRPALACVFGPPGAGKTALAVHVAHAVREYFPDGQWYLPLGGHRPQERPVDPLVELLTHAGLRGGAVPVTAEARAAALRALGGPKGADRPRRRRFDGAGRTPPSGYGRQRRDRHRPPPARRPGGATRRASC
ncbi:hypothetical protein JNW90_32530 [Micromonospora sp. STR1s_5]|nr:hypothetical protein [Micromonospora sp. STR1s_5]